MGGTSPDAEGGSVSPVRTTPVTLLAPRYAPLWTALSANELAVEPSGRAQAVFDFIGEHRASFFDEMVTGVGLLRPQVEEALAELVALGLVTSDSFGGCVRCWSRPTGAAEHRRTPQAPHECLWHGRCGPLGARAPQQSRTERAID
jgi:hypothetical protein